MAKLPAKTREAYITFIEEILFSMMIGMVKSEQFEEDFAAFKEAARSLTKTEFRRIARYAAEYYVQEANPSLSRLQAGRLPNLKKRAINHALERLQNEAPK